MLKDVGELLDLVIANSSLRITISHTNRYIIHGIRDSWCKGPCSQIIDRSVAKSVDGKKEKHKLQDIVATLESKYARLEIQQEVHQNEYTFDLEDRAARDTLEKIVS